MRTLVAEALVEVQLLVRLVNAAAAEHESQHPLDHCQHPHLLRFRSTPCFQIAPLPDRLHAFLALLQPLVALGFSAGNSPNVPASPSLYTRLLQSHREQVANLAVAETDEKEPHRLPHSVGLWYLPLY